MLVAQVNLMRAPTKEKLAEKLAASIHEEIASRLFRARERLRVFAGLQHRPGCERSTPTTARSPSASTRARADRTSTPPSKGSSRSPVASPSSVTGAVALVLDEFQEVAEIDPGLPKLMRSVFQEQPEVAHVYLGSKRHMMERIFNDENEPFWRSAKKIDLGVIPPVLFARYATARFTDTGKILDADVCARILQMTGGHPYATQEALYFLWEATPAGETAEDVRLKRALAALLRSEHAHFSLLWSRAAPRPSGWCCRRSPSSSPDIH